MTDSHSPSHQPTPTPQSTNAAHHAYDGFDPDFPEEKHEADAKAARVSTVQVGASAAAAVTSALAASFFGVAGTLIGAAVGSIVSTVAGALYADYLRKAGNRLRDTKTVVVQRLPAEVLTTTPLRHLTSPVTAATHAPHSTRPVGDPAGPAAVPSRASLQPVTQDGEETVAVPLVTPEEIQQASTSFDPYTVISDPSLHETQLIPRITAETVTQPAVGRLAVTPSGSSGGSSGGSHDPAPSPVTDDRPWWKRPVVMLSGIGVLGFLVAIAVVTVIELGIGHPVSGGGGGTSLSKAIDHKAGTSKPTPTVTVTVTPSATATQPAASATATPTATATGAPTATPTATPTSTSGGTSTGQPTSTTQATSTAGDIAPVATSAP